MAPCTISPPELSIYASLIVHRKLSKIVDAFSLFLRQFVEVQLNVVVATGLLKRSEVLILGGAHSSTPKGKLYAMGALPLIGSDTALHIDADEHTATAEQYVDIGAYSDTAI